MSEKNTWSVGFVRCAAIAHKERPNVSIICVADGSVRFLVALLTPHDHHRAVLTEPGRFHRSGGPHALYEPPGLQGGRLCH